MLARDAHFCHSRRRFTHKQERTHGLATTGDSATAAAARFVSGGTSYYATGVNSARWRHGVLTLDLATSDPGYDLNYRITPKADRYAIHWDVTDPRTTSSVGGDFQLASAGHWYGQGIAVTEQGGPYSDQPWPLDSGHVSDHQLGPFDYFVNDPFWFTQRGTGLWVDTDDVMFVDINSSTNPGVGSFLVTNDTRSNDGAEPNPSEVGESRSYDSGRSVHIPPGHWFDVLHRKVVKGPADIAAYPVTLADVPMFVRLGTRDTGQLIRALTRG